MKELIEDLQLFGLVILVIGGIILFFLSPFIGYFIWSWLLGATIAKIILVITIFCMIGLFVRKR